MNPNRAAHRGWWDRPAFGVVRIGPGRTAHNVTAVTLASGVMMLITAFAVAGTVGAAIVVEWAGTATIMMKVAALFAAVLVAAAVILSDDRPRKRLRAMLSGAVTACAGVLSSVAAPLLSVDPLIAAAVVVVMLGVGSAGVLKLVTARMEQAVPILQVVTPEGKECRSPHDEATNPPDEDPELAPVVPPAFGPPQPAVSPGSRILAPAGVLPASQPGGVRR